MEYVIVNGEFVERSQAKVDIEDRGFQFGDGVYEVIRVYNGKMFTADEHLERLHVSGEKIGLKIPYSVEELKEQLAELISRNDLKLGTIYMQFTRGVSPRNHPFPSETIAPSFTANIKHVGRPSENMENGVKALLKEDVRWLLCDVKSLNLLGNLLAKQEAVAAGCFEAIQHRGETVTEGSASNISIVKDGKVFTHPATNLILNGITRRVFLAHCEKNEIPFAEEAFTLADLSQADEVFLSSTTAEIMPIIQIDNKPVGAGEPGPVTKKLQELFQHEIEEQCGKIM
ncbi:D-amino-acid transaminase [Cytobacillus gottheilii]|uniref:D-amino-acid transaminase n=1 Tax=Cytobacillus gottheilii TaxID=859144 RepID=UPI0009BC2632|nr:D-amino-acid transaminase [Cytobacillus gottheilii]